MSTENTLVQLMELCSTEDGVPCDRCPVKEKCGRWWDSVDIDKTPRHILIFQFQSIRGSKRIAKGGMDNALLNLP